LEGVGMAPQVHADRAADGDDVPPGTVRDARDLIIPGDHAHAFFPLALHLQERGDGNLACHKSPISGMFSFGRFPAKLLGKPWGSIRPVLARWRLPRLGPGRENTSWGFPARNAALALPARAGARGC